MSVSIFADLFPPEGSSAIAPKGSGADLFKAAFSQHYLNFSPLGALGGLKKYQIFQFKVTKMAYLSWNKCKFVSFMPPLNSWNDICGKYLVKDYDSFF